MQKRCDITSVLVLTLLFKQELLEVQGAARRDDDIVVLAKRLVEHGRGQINQPKHLLVPSVVNGIKTASLVLIRYILWMSLDQLAGDDGQGDRANPGMPCTVDFPKQNAAFVQDLLGTNKVSLCNKW